MSLTFTQHKNATDDYAYLNARIRGLKAGLLTSSQYAQLMGARGLDERVEILKNSHLSGPLHRLESPPTLTLIEEALRRDLVQTWQTLLSWMDGRPRMLFDALILYWDMEAVKAVLRGKQARRTPNEILASTLPAGRLSEPHLAELAQAPDLKAVMDILVTWKFLFGKPLARAFPKYEGTQKFFILENAVEGAFFNAVDGVTGKLRDSELSLDHFFRDLKDFFNIRSALRLRGSKFTPLETGRLSTTVESRGDVGTRPLTEFTLKESLSCFLGKGRHIGKNIFISLIEQETGEAACQWIERALSLAEKSKDEMALERVLEHRLFENQMRAFLGNPLAFDILHGFVWHKVAEIRNLRVILRGKAAQIKGEALQEELIHA